MDVKRSITQMIRNYSLPSLVGFVISLVYTIYDLGFMIFFGAKPFGIVIVLATDLIPSYLFYMSMKQKDWAVISVAILALIGIPSTVAQFFYRSGFEPSFRNCVTLANTVVIITCALWALVELKQSRRTS